MRHIPPSYSKYNGAFARLTICENNACQAVGLYEDAHPVIPCRFCGSKVDDHLVGRWIPPTIEWKGFLLRRKEIIEPGFWLIEMPADPTKHYYIVRDDNNEPRFMACVHVTSNPESSSFTAYQRLLDDLNAEPATASQWQEALAFDLCECVNYDLGGAWTENT